VEGGTEAGGGRRDELGVGPRAAPQAVVDVDRGHRAPGRRGQGEQGE
jgi:hypothetical protein